MASHNELGKTGEALAVSHLCALNFEILHRNWRYSRYEIDIIAKKDGKLHFIEVKTRSSNRFGLPEESVSKAKLKTLISAGAMFLHQHKQYMRVQYDILSINIINGKPEYFMIEDVYL